VDTTAKKLLEIGASLYKQVEPWNNLRQQLAEHFYPMRGDFTSSFSPGDDFETGIMDSFGLQARETLGNLPNSMLRQGDWFSVSTGDDDLDKRIGNMQWFDDAKKAMRRTIYRPAAHFVSATQETDHDWVTFGDGAFSVEETESRDALIYKAYHPRDCVSMMNGDGIVDHCQRKLEMTARNVVRRWKDTAHSDIQRMAEKEPSKPIKIRHILCPLDDIYGDDRKMRAKFRKMPFVSFYIDVERQTVLGQGGMPVFNYILPKWRTISGIPIGFSPATINSLPDSRSLQMISSIIQEQGEKALDPPVIGEGNIFRNPINLYAGGFTMVDLDDRKLSEVMQVLESKGQLNFGVEMKQDFRELIGEAFLLNKLFLPDTKDMTAFEANARLDEMRRAALPFFGPYESEFQLKALDVTFEMMIFSKAIPPTPKELDNTNVTFKFDGPTVKLEGQQKVLAYQQGMQMIGGAAQADPTIPSSFKIKEATIDAVRASGWEADWFLDEEEQKQVDQTNEAQTNVAQAATALNQGSIVGKNVADAALAAKQAGLV
jgi:hypothetical protein